MTLVKLGLGHSPYLKVPWGGVAQIWKVHSFPENGIEKFYVIPKLEIGSENGSIGFLDQENGGIEPSIMLISWKVTELWPQEVKKWRFSIINCSFTLMEIVDVSTDFWFWEVKELLPNPIFQHKLHFPRILWFGLQWGHIAEIVGKCNKS